MWKKGLTVVDKRNVFHRYCGKCCGNPRNYVEKNSREGVFHISTGHQLGCPVEMWKTPVQIYVLKELNNK
jgi:hypothetical protein